MHVHYTRKKNTKFAEFFSILCSDTYLFLYFWSLIFSFPSAEWRIPNQWVWTIHCLHSVLGQRKGDTRQPDLWAVRLSLLIPLRPFALVPCMFSFILCRRLNVVNGREPVLVRPHIAQGKQGAETHEIIVHSIPAIGIYSMHTQCACPRYPTWYGAI